MTDTAIATQDERDQQIEKALTAGRSLRTVQREFRLTVGELDQALQRCFPLDTAARLRTLRGDLSHLTRRIETFYTKALAGDVNSGVLCVRAWERKAALLGLDAVQRIDLQIVRPANEPTRHERIREAILRLTRGPEFGDGNGAAPSVASDDPEPK